MTSRFGWALMAALPLALSTAVPASALVLLRSHEGAATALSISGRLFLLALPLLAQAGVALHVGSGARRSASVAGGDSWLRRHPVLAGAGSTLASCAWLALLLIPLVGCPHCWQRPATSMVDSDLRNLASVQDAYRAETGTYAAALDVLEFSASDPVTVSLVGGLDGWSARGVHLNGESCALYVGEIATPLTTTRGRLPERPIERACDADFGPGLLGDYKRVLWRLGV